MLRPVSYRSPCLVFFIGWFILLIPGMAGAEPVAVRTTPLDGEILQRTPTAVGVSFDTPLDTDQSTIRLLHRDGSQVADTSLSWSSDNSSVTLNLPRTFPDGVYTITWHAVSADDGSSTDGWSSFSVGNPEDANIITIPTSASGHSGPPTWVKAGAGWVALVGIAASTAIWPIWRGVLRPALASRRAVAIPATRRWQQVAWIALAIAFGGSLAELVTHSLGARDAGLVDAVMHTLGNDEWGFWWLARMLLLALLGIGLALSPWWYPRWSPFKNSFLWLVSLLLPWPLVLSGHSVDDEVGRTTTVATGYAHAVSLSLLLGCALVVALTVRWLGPAVRTRTMWLLFSAGVTALLTGWYLGHLFAGNRDALTNTAYGQFLLWQTATGAIAIVMALVLVLRSFHPSPSRMVSIALSLALAAVLFASAGMAVVTPARADLAEQSVQTNTALSFDGHPGILLVAPGRAGVNHLRLETPGTYLQTETEVFLELSSPDYPELGSKTVQMYRVQGNAFEHHGTEFSLIGDWEITVRIEEPGFPSSASTSTHTFGAENETVDVPAAPWKFSSLAGLAGLALALAGVTGLATAFVVQGGPLRKEAGGLAAVAVALAVVVILQGRIDPLLVVETGEGAIDPNDLAMVTRGEEVYTTYCLSCHGANLRGDGPLSGSLNPPPTDFDAPHARVHPNSDLTYWIQYGIQGTAMPGFRSQLSDQDIRDVIAYIQNWQQNPEAQANATPALGVCEVTPLTFADIPAIFHHGIHPETRRGTPLVRASDSAVQPEVTNDVMWTLEQIVNCANQDVYMSQLRLFTQPMLQEIYPQGASYEVTSNTTAQPQPVDPANVVTIQDVQSMSYLADGRIAVTVIFSDPVGVGVIPGVQPVTQVTLILVNVDGVWLIDEIR